MSDANNTDRYVQRNLERGGWDVVKEDHQRASAHTDTQAEAIERGKEIVDNLGGGEVRFKNRGGKFRGSTTVEGPKHKESKAKDRQ